jgi:hypothetical protein
VNPPIRPSRLPLFTLLLALGISNLPGAPNKPFPRHWGAPPQIQTMDHIPLPDGYGMGSSTLANWIKRNQERDARMPNEVPKLKQYPAHWGEPPRIQTRDLRPLPGGYGRGSSTLARWIQQNLDRDKAAEDKKTPASDILFATDFSSASPGKPGDELFILDGEFVITETPEGRLLELPGTPLKEFGALFGPNLSTNVAAQARFRGASDGRRHPAFSIGIGGVSGYRLKAVPAKKRIELTLRGEVIGSAPFVFTSNEWTWLKLQCRASGRNWLIEGRAWTGPTELESWTITHATPEAPPGGRASIWGQPFAAQAIQFDDLRVSIPQP